MDLRPIFHPTLLIVAAVYGSLLKIAAVAGLFGIWLGVLVMLSLCRFAYAVLHDTARGRREVAAPGAETANPVHELPFVLHAALFVLLVLLCATTPLFGTGATAALLRWLALGSVLVAFPASAAVLGITRNLAGAMNPFALGTVIRVLGRRYVTLIAACAVLALAAAFTVRVLDSNGFFASLLGDVVSVWAFLALFALIGAAIYEERAGFDLMSGIDAAQARDARDRERTWQSVLDRAYASIRSGYRERGFRTIDELLAAEHQSLDVYDWTFARMLDWEDKRPALVLAPRLLSRLVAEKRAGRALAVVDQCRGVDPAFTPDAAVAPALAAYARTIGRPRLADELDALSGRMRSENDLAE